MQTPGQTQTPAVALVGAGQVLTQVGCGAWDLSIEVMGLRGRAGPGPACPGFLLLVEDKAHTSSGANSGIQFSRERERRVLVV